MSTVRQEEERCGPRVRLRWRVVLDARDLEQLDGRALSEALRRGTAHMEPGLDVIVEVRGHLGCAAGAGRQVGQHLSDARTVEVLAQGFGAAQFTEELEHAATTYVEPWVGDAA